MTRNHELIGKEEIDLICRCGFTVLKVSSPFSFDENFLKERDVDGFVHFRYAHDDDLIQIPPKLETCINEALT